MPLNDLQLPEQAVIEWLDLNLDEIEEIAIAETWDGIGGFTLTEATSILQEADEQGLIVSQALPGLIDEIDEVIDQANDDVKLQANISVNNVDDLIFRHIGDITDGIDNMITNKLDEFSPILDLMDISWNPFDWPSDAAGVIGELIVKGFHAIFSEFLDLPEDVIKESMLKMNKIQVEVAREISNESIAQEFKDIPDWNLPIQESI
tara:strand:+ start:1000 stop:1617 length:618 start_codon:yes stop_codon:yes gene_type:complete